MPAQRALGALTIVAGLAVIGGEAITTIGAHGLVGDLLFVLAGGFFATFGTLLRRWRVAADARHRRRQRRVARGAADLRRVLVGFERIVALGLWENLLQAVMQGLLAGPGAIYLFTRVGGAARRRAGRRCFPRWCRPACC